MSHAITGADRRGLMVACLVAGVADLAFIDAVALPRVMAMSRRGASLVERRPPPTPPALRGGGEPLIATQPLLAEGKPPSQSDLLPRVRAGEVGWGRPSQGDASRAVPTAPAPTPTLALTLHFATADASLPARARAALDAVVAAHPGATFTVNGHADARGDAAFNARLSDLRAAAVAARLQSAGVEAARLHTAAFGATRPAAAGDDPRSLWRNRRVEILVSRGAP